MKKSLPQKPLNFSRHLVFFPGISVMSKNGLISEIRLILKTMTSQTSEQIHILTNISGSKSNQAMKFGYFNRI